MLQLGLFGNHLAVDEYLGALHGGELNLLVVLVGNASMIPLDAETAELNVGRRKGALIVAHANITDVDEMNNHVGQR